MRRYTTPTITLTVTGADVGDCAVLVTFRQGDELLTIGRADFASMATDGERTTIEVSLTQAQTARFDESRDVEVQVNLVDATGYRRATDVATVRFGRNLLEEVVRHG